MRRRAHREHLFFLCIACSEAGQSRDTRVFLEFYNGSALDSLKQMQGDDELHTAFERDIGLAIFYATLAAPT